MGCKLGKHDRVNKNVPNDPTSDKLCIIDACTDCNRIFGVWVWYYNHWNRFKK